MKRWFLLIIAGLMMLYGCTESKSHAKGVYMLLDTSGTYKAEIPKAKAIIKYLLGTLSPGDSLAVARIDTASFSEKDIIAKMTFDNRPSRANAQKRMFLEKVEKALAEVKGSRYTDITGGILQAIEFLNETGAGQKYILIFSDMKEELKKGFVRDVPLQLDGFNVVAINVTKLWTDNVNPKDYLDRLEMWRKRVESSGGRWKVLNDLERPERIFQHR